jgi:murein L,D-transpeptidase YcbB/YkuD
LTAAAGPFAMADVLRSEMTSLRINGKLVVCGETITPNRVLEAIYAQSHFRARWTDDSTVAQLTTEIRRSSGDGLTPEDFHLTALERTRLAPVEELSDTRALVQRDLLLTDALVRLSFHLCYGKVNPRSLNPRGSLTAYIGNQEAASLINRQIEAGSIAVFVGRLRPGHPHYRRLQVALAAYRRMADAGAWTVIPAGALIEKGVRDSRVPAIR